MARRSQETDDAIIGLFPKLPGDVVLHLAPFFRPSPGTQITPEIQNLLINARVLRPRYWPRYGYCPLGDARPAMLPPETKQRRLELKRQRVENRLQSRWRNL